MTEKGRQRSEICERSRTRAIRLDGMYAAETSRDQNRDRTLGAPPVRRQSKANDRSTRSSFLRVVEGPYDCYNLCLLSFFSVPSARAHVSLAPLPRYPVHTLRYTKSTSIRSETSILNSFRYKLTTRHLISGVSAFSSTL